MTPSHGDLIRMKDLYIDGEYENIGIFMGFEDRFTHGPSFYRRMNILLNSRMTFAYVNPGEEQSCIEVLRQAVTGGSDEL